MAGKKEKPIVVFVHGFGSGPDCWDPFRRLIEEDEELTSEFDFAYFKYSTKWFNWNPWEQIPTLSTCADLLQSELTTKKYDGRGIVLVGHSQGGLVVHKYLTSKLSVGKGDTVRNILQVITFATPHEGSDYDIGFVRGFLFWLLRNPQEQRLKTFNEENDEMMDIVKEQIVNAAEVSGSSIPIPIVAFGGETDKIVPPHRQRGRSQKAKTTKLFQEITFRSCGRNPPTPCNTSSSRKHFSIPRDIAECLRSSVTLPELAWHLLKKASTDSRRARASVWA